MQRAGLRGIFFVCKTTVAKLLNCQGDPAIGLLGSEAVVRASVLECATLSRRGFVTVMRRVLVVGTCEDRDSL
eukprot:4810024-Lingulodinium_polyedra.AAC.1